MSRLIFPLALLSVLFTAVCSEMATATTYYIAANGSDSNSGTSKTSPWAHLPGMPTWKGNQTPAAGDTIVLRGCDSWSNANFPVKWTWSGSSGSHITVGGDQNWYNNANCPNGWNRPIFNAGGSAIQPPECGSGNNNTFIYVNGATYVDFNWIELTNYFWANGTCYGAERFMSMLYSDYVTFNNFYIHNWHGYGATSDIDNMIAGGGSPNCSHCALTYSVLDNSDGDANSGGGIQIPANHNICAYLVNCYKTGTAGEYAYTDISHIKNGFAGDHPNCIETLGSGTFYIHDNRIHDVNWGGSGEGCEGLQIGNKGETDYVWNNLMYNMGGNGANGPDIPQSCSTGVTALYYWNNTNVDSRNVCMSFSGCSGNNWTDAFVVQNNHCMTSGTPGGSSQSGGMISGGTVTGAKVITFSNNLVESQSTANSNGYTNSENFVYSPATSSSQTVGAGVNLSTSWPAGFSTADTSYACSEQTVQGVIQSVCPSRTSISRPTGNVAWDVGAYMFSSDPAPNPPTGLAALVH